MKRSYLIIIAVLVVLVGLWYWQRNRGEEIAVDLVEEFAGAKKQSNLDPSVAFSVADITLNGETKRAINIHPTSRLTYHLTVPDGGKVHVSLGIKQETWDKQSDGVLFRIGVSDGQYEELLNQHVNPSNNQGDRRWIPVVVDLSGYSGQEVDLIFNTNSSLPRQGDNPAWDWAVLGDPVIVKQK